MVSMKAAWVFQVTFYSSTGSRSRWPLPNATVHYWLLLHLLLCPGAASARSLGLLCSSSETTRLKKKRKERQHQDMLLKMQVFDITLLYSKKAIIPLRTVLFFLVYHRYCPSSSRQHSLRWHDHCLFLQCKHVKIHTFGLSWWASFFSLPICDRSGKTAKNYKLCWTNMASLPHNIMTIPRKRDMASKVSGVV